MHLGKVHNPRFAPHLVGMLFVGTRTFVSDAVYITINVFPREASFCADTELHSILCCLPHFRD